MTISLFYPILVAIFCYHNLLATVRAVLIDMQVSDLYVLDLYDFYVYMAFFVFCFCCFTSHVNSYGHCGTVSSLNHTFSWAGLSKRLTSNLCTYFRL